MEQAFSPPLRSLPPPAVNVIEITECRVVADAQDRRTNSGSLAMLAAIRRASSRVRSLAAARRLGSPSK
jgi:hypothetical protein